MSEKIQIVRDSREQIGLDFDGIEGVEVIDKSLKTGDYSILGYEDKFCVEFKSCSDLIGTMDSNKGDKKHSNRERFKLELQRMQDGFDFYCILIGCHHTEILPECHRIAEIQREEGRKRVVNPSTRAKGVIGSLKAFRVDFNCHHYWIGSRERAAKWIVEQAKYFLRHK